MLTSSGQAANFFALFNICEAGSHIVSSSSIYGGTYNLLAVTMKKMGVYVTFVAPDCTEEELNAAFKEDTRAVLVNLSPIRHLQFLILRNLQKQRTHMVCRSS